MSDRIKIKLVYAGPVKLTKQTRLGTQWFVVNEDNSLGASRLFAWSKTLRHDYFEVGETREFEQDAENSIYGRGQYISRRSGPEVDQWKAGEKALLIEMELEARRKRESAKYDTEAAEPLRQQYRKLIGHTRRAAFLAHVIEYITS